MPATPSRKPTKSGRTQRKKPQTLISAAVSIQPDLYEKALVEARLGGYDNNFSRYVRTLISRDLSGAA